MVDDVPEPAGDAERDGNRDALAGVLTAHEDERGSIGHRLDRADAQRDDVPPFDRLSDALHRDARSGERVELADEVVVAPNQIGLVGRRRVVGHRALTEGGERRAHVVGVTRGRAALVQCDANAGPGVDVGMAPGRVHDDVAAIATVEGAEVAELFLREIREHAGPIEIEAMEAHRHRVIGVVRLRARRKHVVRTFACEGRESRRQDERDGQRRRPVLVAKQGPSSWLWYENRSTSEWMCGGRSSWRAILIASR